MSFMSEWHVAPTYVSGRKLRMNLKITPASYLYVGTAASCMCEAAII